MSLVHSGHVAKVNAELRFASRGALAVAEAIQNLRIPHPTQHEPRLLH